MFKVHVLGRCPHCGGKSCLPAGELLDSKGQPYTCYVPCTGCYGSGNLAKWITIDEFLEMLKASQCKHEHTSYRGGLHASGGDVWDDIQEVCDDCGANLDRQTLADYILDLE